MRAALPERPPCRPEVLLAAVACTFLLCTPALAGIGEGNGEIGLDLGFTSFDADLVDETAYRVSVRLGQHVDRYLQYEGQYAVSPASEELLPGVTKEATLHILMLNGLFNFRPRRSTIVPYVLAGVGLARLELEAVGLSSDDTDGTFQFAVGSRFFFGEGDRIAFRVELSLVSNDAFDQNYDHLNLVGGLTWRLGPEP